MRTISDTLARMAAFQGRPSPVGGIVDRLATLDGFANPGALTGRTHVPANLAADAPLVVALHGCTQTAAAYDHGTGWSTLADRAGFAVLFPEQPRANNPNTCFNWFAPGDIARLGGEAESIARMVEAMIATHGLDRRRVYVTGLSAGGAMAAVMLATWPDLFAGGAIIGGLPYGAASSVSEALDRMRGHGGADTAGLVAAVRRASGGYDGPWPTVSIWHGGADHTVAPSNMDRLSAQWRGVHGIDAGAAVTMVGPHEHRRWTGSDGRVLVEEWRIAGMGHGVPIDATGAIDAAGDAALGASGPYMLDVGVSSTDLIAREWGLTTGDAVPISAVSPAPPNPVAVFPSVTPPAVQKVIEDALRSAGLMR